MCDAEFLELAHHIIDALKKVTYGGTTDEDIRRIVTGGITNGRDVFLDELHYQIAHGKTDDADTQNILAKVAALDDYGRAAVCSFAAMIIRDRPLRG